MTDRRAEDLRRIVKFKITKGALGAAPDRDSIAGKRAIAYDGGSRLGVPGQTLAPVDTDGTTADDGANPFDNLFFSSTDGAFGADRVLDGELAVGDELRELQAEDCTSGDQLNLRSDGEIPPPNAVLFDDGSTKSSRWTSPDTPPDKVGFVQGIQWTESNGTIHANPIDAAQAHADLWNTNLVQGVSDWRVFSLNNVHATLYQYEIFSDTAGSPGPHLFGATGTSCTPTEGLASCPLESKETAYPEDSQATMTLEDGCFEYNEFETETSPEYLGCRSVVDFCTADGRFGRMELTGDGGFMISERDTQGGVLTAGGQYQVFGADRKLKGSVNEESAETLRPKDVTAPSPLP